MLYLNTENFFTDPFSERLKALDSEYKDELHNGINYRGISIQKDNEGIAKIEGQLGEKLLGEPVIYYRRYLENEENETYIHSDCQIGKYTCVAYLSEEEASRGGTAFWKHRKYGWEYQPTKAEMDALRLPDTKEFWEEIWQQGFDEKHWELLGIAPMKFNRAIIFDSRRFHSRYPQKAFGSNLETSRLVKVFFLNEDPRYTLIPFDAARDYPEVCSWWNHYGFPPLPLDHLSTRGFIVWDKVNCIGTCAGWLYATDSAFSWIDWVVSNPKVSARERVKTIELLLRNVSAIGLRTGAKSIHSSTKHNGLKRLYERVGFKSADSGMTNLVLRGL